MRTNMRIIITIITMTTKRKTGMSITITTMMTTRMKSATTRTAPAITIMTTRMRMSMRTTIITITTTAMTPTRFSSAGARKRIRNSRRPRSNAS